MKKIRDLLFTTFLDSLSIFLNAALSITTWPDSVDLANFVNFAIQRIHFLTSKTLVFFCYFVNFKGQKAKLRAKWTTEKSWDHATHCTESSVLTAVLRSSSQPLAALPSADLQCWESKLKWYSPALTSYPQIV